MKSKRRKIAPRRKKINEKQRGKASFYLLILIIILGSIIFVQGLAPKMKLSPPSSTEELTVLSVTPADERKKLQLDTFGFKKCGEKAAIDFIIDVSGSMKYGNKMDNLKNSLTTFAGNFPGEGVIGMQLFSVYPSEAVSIGKFKDRKSEFLRQISLMSPQTGTHTKDAFLFAKPILQRMKTIFPEQQNYAVVFISDGVPETLERNTQGRDNNECTTLETSSRYCMPSPEAQGACRCFDTDQDPTDVANEIKNVPGFRIFSIGYISGEDEKFQADLETLMKAVASSENDFYQAPITNQITEILKQISTQICQSSS